ncbi:MAG: pitrilysin family protein [candidate division FCPU426 bacterium]
MDPKTLLLGGLLAAAPMASLAAGVGAGVSKHVLPNGMTVLVKEVHSAPVVAVNAWVKVGSVHEEDKERGITHFIEHMLFKGTEKLKVGELDKTIKAAGGYNNAHTRYESTDFIDVMPSDKLDIALETTADALQHSKFDAAELDRERNVVLEELHRAQDNPSFEAWNKLTNLVFEKHPYKYPVIGYKDLLQKMDRSLLVQYWQKWYRPQNIVLVIVGDVKAEEVQAKVAKIFSAWSAGKSRPKLFPAEAEQQGLRLVEFDAEIQTTMAILGVPGPAETDKDAPAVDMALAILGQGISSRLNQEVRERLKLVHGVSAGQFNGMSPGLIYLWAELEPAQLKAAVKALWAEAERMKVEPVSDEELARQRVKIEHEEAGELMNMEGMAGRLGYYECLGDYRLGDTLTQQLRDVTAKDVLRVMNQYFQPQRATLVISRPKGSKPTGMKAADWSDCLRASSKAAPKKDALAGKKSGKLSRYRFDNGVELIVKPMRHTPLVAMQAVMPGGSHLDPSGKGGAFNLLGRLLLKGAAGMDAVELADKLDDLGAAIAPHSEADRFVVTAQMLSSKFEETLELSGKILRQATLPLDELEKERERVLKDIKDKTDSADDYVGDVFNALFFKGTPYALPEEGSAASVKRITRNDLETLRRRYLAPDHLLITLAGDIDPERAAKVVAKVFGPERWDAVGPSAPAPAPKAVAPKAQRAQEKLAKKQAHIMLGWTAPSPLSPDYYPARILNSVMGEGMDSRLFVEVRDKRALCYTVQSFMDRRVEPGAWRVYVGTQPENEKLATELVLKVAAELAENGITAEELKSAKAYSKGIFQVARQDFSTEARLLTNYEFWGLGAEAVDAYAKAVDAVTLEDVKRVAKKYLLTSKTSVAVVRP